VTGDVAHDGTEAEYKRAGIWLDSVADAVGCPKAKVCVVPGNHDVDRTQIACVTSMIHERIRGGTPTAAQADIENLAKEYDQGSHPLLRTVRAYHEFAEQYGCTFESAARPFWQKKFALSETRTLVLVGMTTVQVSNIQDAKGNMILVRCSPCAGQIWGRIKLVFLCVADPQMRQKGTGSAGEARPLLPPCRVPLSSCLGVSPASIKRFAPPWPGPGTPPAASGSPGPGADALGCRSRSTPRGPSPPPARPRSPSGTLPHT